MAWLGARKPPGPTRTQGRTPAVTSATGVGWLRVVERAGLHRGDRLEVRQDGALCRACGMSWVTGWRGYSFAVEVDRGGVLERVAALEAEAQELGRLLG